ncbi:hypothetical protein [Vibrio vulnificus]|uniref:hypothetical protein n=1 Tax=Vibrio vulnificus TaxID=672 RepID=UPI003242E3A9
MDLVEKEDRKVVERESDRLMKIGRKTNSGSNTPSAKEQSNPAWPIPRKSKKAN